MSEQQPAESDTYADVHSVLCYAHRVPHDHGHACHSTCPTCGGSTYVIPSASTDSEVSR